MDDIEVSVTAPGYWASRSETRDTLTDIACVFLRQILVIHSCFPDINEFSGRGASSSFGPSPLEPTLMFRVEGKIAVACMRDNARSVRRPDENYAMAYHLPELGDKWMQWIDIPESNLSRFEIANIDNIRQTLDELLDEVSE